MSLRVRLLAASAYVLVLVLVVLEIPLALNLARRVDAEVRGEAAGAAHLLAASASGRLTERPLLDGLVANGAREVGGRVIVVDHRGRLLADSAGPAGAAVSYADRPEIASVLQTGRVAQGERRSGTLGEVLLYTTVPIVEAGRRVGAVRVTQSMSAVRGEIRRDVVALAGIGLIALMLGLGVAWLLAGSLSRPLRSLAGAAERVAAGDLEARADVVGSREQQEVATAFNDMAVRVGQSLAAQREFVGNASHQLRTPLTGLQLRLEAATARAEDPELLRDLAAAERETERLARLLAGLLTLAREGDRPALREPLDLEDAARDAAARWEPAAERTGHSLELAGDGAVRAWVSREDAAIILDNLIENALVYSPTGTAVTLAWGDTGSGCRLAVLDEGPGFEAGEEARVFDRFVRGAAGKGTAGTGLGLAIVQALAERWDGAVRIGRRPEGGAAVELLLRSEDLPSSDPRLEKALPGSAYGGGR
ncbi:MAG TPA: ATP-binding protein [Gaiella sp.]